MPQRVVTPSTSSSPPSVGVCIGENDDEEVAPADEVTPDGEALVVELGGHQEDEEEIEEEDPKEDDSDAPKEVSPRGL